MVQLYLIAVFRFICHYSHLYELYHKTAANPIRVTAKAKFTFVANTLLLAWQQTQ